MKVENPPSDWLSPGRLITMSEIMRFAAGPLFTCLLNLERHALELRGTESDKRLTEQRCDELEKLLSDTSKSCNKIGFDGATWHIVCLKKRLKENCSGMEMGTELARLRETIEFKVEGLCFVFVPPDKVGLYQNRALFGKAVDERFPSARRDIEESGTCLALECYEACVFHSMRVLEHGLLAMAERITSTKMKDPNWSGIIKAIENEIERRDKGNRTPKWKREREFFIAGALHFRYLKDSWRNYVMHATGVHHDPAEARMVFEHTRDLMQHLATKLKER